MLLPPLTCSCLAYFNRLWFIAGADGVQRFEQQPSYTEVNPGQDALLVCKVFNKRGSCSWQKDNKVSLHIANFSKKLSYKTSKIFPFKIIQNFIVFADRAIFTEEAKERHNLNLIYLFVSNISIFNLSVSKI